MATDTNTIVGRVMAAGTARHGGQDWMIQRMTSIALVPLSLWFIVSAVGLAGTGYGEARHWLASPFNATAMVLLIITLFWHAQLGVRVIIEDYVHQEGIKLASLLLLQFAAIALGLTCVIAVLKITVGS